MDVPKFRILNYGLSNLLLHFNCLLGRKVPKLLASYGNWKVINGGAIGCPNPQLGCQLTFVSPIKYPNTN